MPDTRRESLTFTVVVTALVCLGAAAMLLVIALSGAPGSLALATVLAALPVGPLVGCYLWLDRYEPEPRRLLALGLLWGAFVATAAALIIQGIGGFVIGFTDRQSLAVVAPISEEASKGLFLLLLLWWRRAELDGILDGIVYAGMVGVGFAFTENILYLGSAFGEDQAYGDVYGDAVGLRTTAATFFVRVVMTPFAHPLFTSLTGIGFAIAAVSRPGKARLWLAPLGGWLLAMVLHGTWNGSASFSPLGFLAIYATLMIPLFACLVWLAVWSRFSELKTIRTQLPVYATAGWLTPPEPVALGSMKARSLARSAARHHHGEAAARTVREYQSFATSLAFLRARATQGSIGSDFAAREQELLHHLWQRKAVAQPALIHAAFTVHPPYPAHPVYPAHPAFQPPMRDGHADNGYGNSHANRYGNGYPGGYGADWRQTHNGPYHQPYQPPHPQ
jgi:protease PrsW